MHGASAPPPPAEHIELPPAEDVAPPFDLRSAAFFKVISPILTHHACLCRPARAQRCTMRRSVRVVRRCLQQGGYPVCQLLHFHAEGCPISPNSIVMPDWPKFHCEPLNGDSAVMHAGCSTCWPARRPAWRSTRRCTRWTPLKPGCRLSHTPGSRRECRLVASGVRRTRCVSRFFCAAPLLSIPLLHIPLLSI